MSKYIARQMIGNYSTIIGQFDDWNEAEDFIQAQARMDAMEECDMEECDIEECDIEECDMEMENALSYYSIEER